MQRSIVASAVADAVQHARGGNLRLRRKATCFASPDAEADQASVAELILAALAWLSDGGLSLFHLAKRSNRS